MIILQNEVIQAGISTMGAELQSLKNTATGLQYMWSGDPQYWGKFSPVLFPIVGSLVGNTYLYNGKSYQLPRHGFAREMEFLVTTQNNYKVVFALGSTEATLQVYPFPFLLELEYQLMDNQISCTYRVSNKGVENMYFSIGAHPAFAVPVVKDTPYETHFLQFSEEEPLTRWKLKEGLLSGITENESAPKGRLSLSPTLFYNDALVFKHLNTKRITLASTAHHHGLHMDFNGFPYMGIWAAKDASFVCIEPWCGHADAIDHNQQLPEKSGIECIAPQNIWERTWTVSCF